jgi:hypothetical protein
MKPEQTEWDEEAEEWLTVHDDEEIPDEMVIAVAGDGKPAVAHQPAHNILR